MFANASTPQLKLYMLLLGSRAPGRHVEQHDFFFGIAASLKELIPDIQAFWPEVKGKIHIDAWREVTVVDGYRVIITAKGEQIAAAVDKKLFFINLGGYQQGKFEEQHYVVLTVKNNRTEAFKEAKQTLFFKNNHFEKATAHIDDRYGIDVDDVYQIKDILPAAQKQRYQIALVQAKGLIEDEIHLGYLKLALLK